MLIDASVLKSLIHQHGSDVSFVDRSNEFTDLIVPTPAVMADDLSRLVDIAILGVGDGGGEVHEAMMGSAMKLEYMTLIDRKKVSGHLG